MLKERFIELLSRKMTGEATETELHELEQWVKHNPADQYFSEILLSYWHSRYDTTPSINAITPDQHFAHILDMAKDNAAEADTSPIVPPSGFFIGIKRLGIAATVAALVVLTVLVINNRRDDSRPTVETEKSLPQKNEVVARKGARSRIVLPDGTRVWLNSDSKLQYGPSFNEDVREVTLEGEAYFDVVKDQERPFIVHTSGIDIRVLGTAFNLKSYPQEPTIEATLIHGFIEVINKKEAKSPSVILEPHKKLVFNKENQSFEGDKPGQKIKPITSATSTIAITALPQNIADTSLIETSWVYNRLLFDGETFQELAIKMERWFNVKINFKSEKVANYRMRGAFDTETIEEALQALQVIASFSYKIKNNEIDISNK